MPIEIVKLRAVRSIIVHRGSSAPCPDGRAAALILRAALPDVPIVEMTYNSSEHQRLLAEPGMLFCDFTPPADRVQDFVDAGAIVLDHHDPKLVEPFAAVGLGVWGDNAKGESGAVLAAREVLSPLATPDLRLVECEAVAGLARLAGIRDTWQTNHRDWVDACEVAAALAFPTLDDLLTFSTDEFLYGLAPKLGPILVAKQREAAERAAKNAVLFYLCGSGKRLVVIDDHHAINDAAELLKGEADVIAAFEYTHDDPNTVRLVVHLRSRGEVDVRAIAQQYGGGGHKLAAGFSVPVDPDPDARGQSPYRLVYGRIASVLDAAV